MLDERRKLFNSCASLNLGNLIGHVPVNCRNSCFRKEELNSDGLAVND